MSAESGVRVMLFAVDGPYQRYLAMLLDREFDLCGIVVRYRPDKQHTVGSRVRRQICHPLEFYRHLTARVRLPRYARRARSTYQVSLSDELGYPPRFPDCRPRLDVPDINAAEVSEFVRRHRPDVICVNGTNLIREPLLSEGADLPLGLINLHSGLSPYTRGGNCNLFALADGRPEWVGMTVHHVDPGIDSGDLILTARPEMFATDNYEDIEIRSFGLGIRMVVDAVRRLTMGTADRVPQWQSGRLYLARTGFVYSPWRRLQVNRLLDRGLIRDYLAEKAERHASIRLVGGTVVTGVTAAA